MKSLTLLSVAIASSFLVGCTATTPKQDTADSANADVVGQSAEQVAPARAPSPASVQNTVNPNLSNNQIAPPDALSKLQGQITALQEQVIKLTSDTAASLKINQLLLAKAQVQAASSTTGVSPQIAPQQSNTVTNNQQLNTVLSKLESISPSPRGAYGIVSSYTARKQWVLIRFDRQTGETWLADNSGWNALTDSAELPVSQYDVHLIRADQDSKGYVASRIDQRSGETWWLNKNRWVVYQ